MLRIVTFILLLIWSTPDIAHVFTGILGDNVHMEYGDLSNGTGSTVPESEECPDEDSGTEKPIYCIRHSAIHPAIAGNESLFPLPHRADAHPASPLFEIQTPPPEL